MNMELAEEMILELESECERLYHEYHRDKVSDNEGSSSMVNVPINFLQSSK